jgi:hypothetical protein
VSKAAVARTWSIRAADACTSRRTNCRLGWGTLRNSRGLASMGSRRVKNLTLAGSATAPSSTRVAVVTPMIRAMCTTTAIPKDHQYSRRKRRKRASISCSAGRII